MWRLTALYYFDVLLTFIDSSLFFSMRFDVFREPLIELVMGVEQCGHNEMQQGPQL